MKKPKPTKTKKAGSSRKAPKSATPEATPRVPRTRERDPRLPAAGTVIKRLYKGTEYRVTVLEDGFRYDGREFRSLSKLASEITGAKSINGFLWMRLTGVASNATKQKGKHPAATEIAPALDAAPATA